MLARRIKKSATEIILDILQGGAETAVDLFETMMSSYPESYRRARRGMLGEPVKEFEKSWSEIYRQRKNFYSLLQKLKRDGLIESRAATRGRRSLWKTTNLGNKKHRLLKNESEKRKWLQERQKSSAVIIVSYDIPESYRRERDWVRDILKFFHFAMIHKSVWVGTTVLPRQFLDELRRKGILEHIEIFEVSKRGTISRLAADG